MVVKPWEKGTEKDYVRQQHFLYYQEYSYLFQENRVIYILMSLNFYINRWSHFIPWYIYLHIPDTVSFRLYIS